MPLRVCSSMWRSISYIYHVIKFRSCILIRLFSYCLCTKNPVCMSTLIKRWPQSLLLWRLACTLDLLDQDIVSGCVCAQCVIPFCRFKIAFFFLHLTQIILRGVTSTACDCVQSCLINLPVLGLCHTSPRPQLVLRAHFVFVAVYQSCIRLCVLIPGILVEHFLERPLQLQQLLPRAGNILRQSSKPYEPWASTSRYWLAIKTPASFGCSRILCKRPLPQHSGSPLLFESGEWSCLLFEQHGDRTRELEHTEEWSLLLIVCECRPEGGSFKGPETAGETFKSWIRRGKLLVLGLWSIRDQSVETFQQYLINNNNYTSLISRTAHKLFKEWQLTYRLSYTEGFQTVMYSQFRHKHLSKDHRKCVTQCLGQDVDLDM